MANNIVLVLNTNICKLAQNSTEGDDNAISFH